MPLGSLYMIRFESHLQQMLRELLKFPKTTIFNIKKVQNQRAFGFGFLKVLEIKEPFGFSFSKSFQNQRMSWFGVQKFSNLLGP